MATSVISKDFFVTEHIITTVANSGVSPFGAYYSLDNLSVSGYRILSVELMGVGSTNPAIARPYSDDGVFIYSKSPASFGARIIYGKV